MEETAFLLARLVIATSMLGHGLVRIPKLAAFSEWMTGLFSKSMMPSFLVVPFSYALPILEFTLGVLLVLGLFTHQALIASTAIMIALIFGSCMIENWEAVSFQMFYGLFFSLLLANLTYNHYSLDHAFGLNIQKN